MEKTILGIDIGPNSIGWALLGCDEDGEPNSIIRTGVRIFQEAVDRDNSGNTEPKNANRRLKRLVRRRLARVCKRKNRLRELLTISQILPESETEFDELVKLDPWTHRVKGLDESLTLAEFGRVLYHMSQRRGFKSGRKESKAGDETKKKEESKLKQAMSELEKRVANSGFRTLAEYLVENKLEKRKQPTTRKLYEEEFHLLWEKQQEFYPEVLTDELRTKVYREIFFQRKTYVKQGSVGKCTFEEMKPRAKKATLSFQEFRLWQDINSLSFIDQTTGEQVELASNQYLQTRQKLFHYLTKREKAEWNAIKREIGLHSTVEFNFEKSKKSGLKGNETNAKLNRILGTRWDTLQYKSMCVADSQNALIEDLITIDEDDLYKRLTDLEKPWKFDRETALKLCELELTAGYASVSQRAIRNILPYLRQGQKYHEACKSAGYDHSNPNKNTSEVDTLPPHEDLRNPVVNKALNEVRKVVNAIVRKHEKPSVIRVELAREVKLTGEKLRNSIKKQKQREKENEDFKDELKTNVSLFQNIEPRRDDLIKYRLWKECGECPYTGKPISLTTLFSPDVEIEHIFPYSRSLDDSQMNKTLCLRSENSKKKNRTPYEAYSDDLLRFEEIKQRIQKLPYPKRIRFTMKNIPDDFVARQLNETAYIARAIADFLKQLGVKVEVSKGKITSDLRYQWGLNRILSEDGSNEKNRADHRHHTIDAIVIAMTSRKIYMEIQRLANESKIDESRVKIEKLWKTFYDDIKQSIESIIVSHAPYRKVAGAFHKETAYGKTPEKDTFVVRTELSALTEADLRKNMDKDSSKHTIRDNEVRKMVVERYMQCGNDLKKAFSPNAPQLYHKDGVTPIKKVRLLVTFDEDKLLAVKDAQGKEYKFYPTGSNHHYEIFISEDGTKKDGRIVSTLDAKRRIKEGKPLIDKTFKDGWKFYCSLIINDMVKRNSDGKYYRVQMLTDGVITMRLHTASTLQYNKTERWFATPNTFDAKKICVDSLGNVSSTND